MSQDAFKSRERAFEAVYFARVDAQKIEAIRKERETEAELGLLSADTGIHDEEVLGRILALGITSRNLEALSLAPLIAVAWANGDLEPKERKAAIENLVAEGVEEGSEAYELFSSWLADKPGGDLMDAWRDYIGSVLERLDPEARTQVQKDLVERAEKVAKAAGGIAGFGSVSAKERDVLDEIVSALGAES